MGRRCVLKDTMRAADLSEESKRQSDRRAPLCFGQDSHGGWSTFPWQLHFIFSFFYFSSHIARSCPDSHYLFCLSYLRLFFLFNFQTSSQKCICYKTKKSFSLCLLSSWTQSYLFCQLCNFIYSCSQWHFSKPFCFRCYLV